MVKVFMGAPSTGTRVDAQNYVLREIEERYAGVLKLVYPKQCVQRIFHDNARNAMVEEFLESDCDMIWFLDSDVVPPKHVMDLVAVHYDKWEAAGAPYPIWMTVPGGEFPTICYTAYKGFLDNAKERGFRMSEVPYRGTEFVDALATGCLMLKRSIFDKLERPWFEFKYDPITRNIIEGEDLGFALKAKKAGFKFFVDYGAVCKHYKNVDLLDIQNYATDWSNGKVMEYDKEIRSKIDSACEAAYAQGKIDAARELQELTQQRTSKGGLILPRGLGI